MGVAHGWIIDYLASRVCGVSLVQVLPFFGGGALEGGGRGCVVLGALLGPEGSGVGCLLLSVWASLAGRTGFLPVVCGWGLALACVGLPARMLRTTQWTRASLWPSF